MKKSKEQKIAIKNIKTLYESREKVMKLFDDYSKILSEAKYKTNMGKISKYQLLNKCFKDFQ